MKAYIFPLPDTSQTNGTASTQPFEGQDDDDFLNANFDCDTNMLVISNSHSDVNSTTDRSLTGKGVADPVHYPIAGGSGSGNRS
jgi:hypothetical protein